MIARVYVRLVRAAEARPWSLASPFVATAWVAAMRILGERLAVIGNASTPRSPVLWWLHIHAFYLALLACLGALLARSTGLDWRKAFNLVGVGLLTGILPPILDSLISGPGHFSYEYQTGAIPPFTLYSPPNVLPAGEALVLWAAILMLGAYGFWRGSGWRRWLVAPMAYVLVLFFQALLPTALLHLARAWPGPAPTEWKIVAFVSCAFVGTVVATGLGMRFLWRLPQVILAPVFCLLGAAAGGRLDGTTILVMWHFALISAGFALSNDWYDREEDAAAGRTPPADGDAAMLLSTLPLVALAGLVATHFEAGLCAVGFVAVSYAYQADPLRLKCVFPLSYKTEGLLAGLAFLAPLLARSGDLPESALLLAALLIALGTPVALVFKDAKDIEGDRRAGVRTAFVVGLDRGLSARLLNGLARLGVTVALVTAVAAAALFGTTFNPAALGCAFLPAVFLIAVSDRTRATILAIVASETCLVLVATGLIASRP